MAGFYPDVPGFRFEYDRDGSVVMWDGSNTASLTQMQNLNNETWHSGAGSVNAQNYIGIAWPEPRDVVGIYTVSNAGAAAPTDKFDCRISANTTNGSDGTWTHLVDVPMNVIATNPNVPTHCRTDIFAITGATAIRGMQFYPYVYRGGSNTSNLHIYGQIPLTSNPDRLVLCDTTGTPTINGAYLDFGDAARSTTATISFRIKNNSAVSTANSIAMSFQQLFDASPTLAGQFQYSFNSGASWVTTGNIGNLAPGALSPVIQVRRNTLAAAAVGPWQSRVVAVPASMT